MPKFQSMSEPKDVARKIVPVVPGIVRWSLADDRIGGFESDAHAIVRDGKLTLIDPLPIESALLDALGEVEAIVLTAGNHQRSAWRMRSTHQVPVFAPRNAQGLEGQPDGWFEGGDALPGGLVAFHTPGPVESMHVLWAVRPFSVVFMADLLTHDGTGKLAFVPSEYQDEPSRTRLSVRRVLDNLFPQAICFNHGPPLVQGVTEALERVLRNDTEHRTAPSHFKGERPHSAEG